MADKFQIKQVPQQKPDKALIKEQRKAEKQALKEQQQHEREKQLKKKQAAKKEKRSLIKRLKETGSELKKVSWPKFSTVIKSTGVVLSVVAFFLVVLFGFDTALGYLTKWFLGIL